jgi:hypothetical protein
MTRNTEEMMNCWETKCREQDVKCEYCPTCTPQLIRDRFIVGVNDDTLVTKIVDQAVRDKDITLEAIVLHAQQYESTRLHTKTMAMSNIEEQVNFAH